jgi:hypothetical protein
MALSDTAIGALTEVKHHPPAGSEMTKSACC